LQFGFAADDCESAASAGPAKARINAIAMTVKTISAFADE
jgi:hypothetical protein